MGRPARRRSTGPVRAAGWARSPPDLGARPAVEQHDVGGEVVLAADQRGADAVGVDGDVGGLELADPRGGEAAADDDLDVGEAGAVERAADLLDQAGVDAGGLEAAHLVPQRAVDEQLGGVQAHAPQLALERLGHLERGGHRVVDEVDQHGDVHVAVEVLGELDRGLDGVAAVGGDQAVGDGADPAPAPPGRLGVGGDADRAGDVGAPAVAGLDQPVVVAGGEVEDLLAAGRLDDLGDVAHDQRAAGQRAQVDGLQVGEHGVVALDRHHRLAGGDAVALLQRVDLEAVPAGDPLAVCRSARRRS